MRTDARVDRIDVGAGGVEAVIADGERIDADAVILAVPHDAAATLLPPTALPGRTPAALSGLGASPIVNVHLVFDRPVMDHAFAAGVGSPVQYVFDRTRSAGMDPADGQCLAISLSGADRYVGTPPRELVATFTTAIARALPARA